jgi:hypothetical protein
VVVTASNIAGTFVEPSPLSANPVSDGALPANDPGTPPTVSPSPAVGVAAQISPGTWTGTGTTTWSYQWQSCASHVDLTTCHDLPGETSLQHTPAQAEHGAYLRAIVVGHNPIGVSAPVTTAVVGPVS